MEGNTASDFVSSQGCDSCLGITVGVGRGGLLSSLCVVLDCVVSLCLCALLSGGNIAADLVWSHGWDSCVRVRKVAGVGC